MSDNEASTSAPAYTTQELNVTYLNDAKASPVAAEPTAATAHPTLSAAPLPSRTHEAPAATGGEVHSLTTEQEQAFAAIPEATHPTVVFLIPFPPLSPEHLASQVGSKKKKPLAPFFIYAPPAERLAKPAEGEKESLVHKAQRKWEAEEDTAQTQTGIKSKLVNVIGKGMNATKNSGIDFLVRTPEKKKLKELRIIYPSDYNSTALQQDFVALIKGTKSGAIKSSILATALTPFALAFDTLTFVPGPFEVCAVWASSSWIGTARASAIASGVTSDKLPINFKADQRLQYFAHRLSEICHTKASKGLFTPLHWSGEGAPKRDAELATILLAILKEEGADGFDADRRRVTDDFERTLLKAAKEYVKAAS